MKYADKSVIGSRIREEREKRSLSQAELAEEVNVDTANVSRWERGETFPHPRQRKALCTALGKSFEEFFGEETNSVREDTAPEVQHPSLPPQDPYRLWMSRRVYNIWIRDVLEHPLYYMSHITVGLHEQPNAVTNPLRLVVQQMSRQARSLPPDTSIVHMYDDVQGELLILGKPGSGKTTLLLELARVLLERARHDQTQPIPVIFPLASWAIRRQPIEAWLIDELHSKYKAPRKLCLSWIEQDKILPLLDALDEVKEQHRATCITAINDYHQEHGTVPLVVCSRSDDYLGLMERLHLQGAVVIEPLTAQQIDSYLSKAGKSLEAARAALHDDPELRELVNTPFMLNVLALAYYDKSVDELQAIPSPELRRKQLFTSYVERTLLHQGARMQYSLPQIIRWLSWLAQQMTLHSQSPYYIEYTQMDWVSGGLLHWLYPGLGVGLVYGLFFWLIKGLSYVLLKGADQYGRPFTLDRAFIDGLCVGFFNALLFVLFNGLIFGLLEQYVKAQVTRGKNMTWQRKCLTILSAWPIYGLFNGLGNGLLIGWLTDPPTGIYNGLFIGLLYAGLGRLPSVIKSAEATSWSWKSLQQNAFVSMGSGVGIGLLYGGLTALYWQFRQPYQILSPSKFFPCLLFGLSVGLVVGSFILVTRGLSHEKPARRDKPNQGIWNAALYSTVLGLVAFLIVVILFRVIYELCNGELLQLIFHLFRIPFSEYAPYFPKTQGVFTSLMYGLIVGAFLWLRNGGTTCIQHIVLRLCLWRKHSIPWRYPQFLDEAAKHILLYKVGGGYIFIHPLLQEYFAEKTCGEVMPDLPETSRLSERTE